MTPRSVVLSCVVLALSQAAAQGEPAAVRPGRAPLDSARLAKVLDSLPPADSSAQARRRGPGCWRAQGPTRCRSFLVTDIGIEFPVYVTGKTVPGPTGGSRDFGPRLVWGIGAMRNFSGNKATGAVVSITSEFSPDKLPWMLEWRFRQWRNPSSAFDVGIGYKTNSVWQGGTEYRGRGVTAMAAWSPSRWIGINGRVELIGANGQTHPAVALGVQSTRASEFVFQMIGIGIARLLENGIEFGN